MEAKLRDDHFHAEIEAPFGNSYYDNTFYVNSYLKADGRPFEAVICRHDKGEAYWMRGTDYTDNPVVNPNFFNEPIERVEIPGCVTMAEAAGKVMAVFADFIQQVLAKDDCPPKKQVTIKYEVVEVAE